MSVHIRIRNGLQPDGEGNGGASEGDIRGNSTDFIDTYGVVDLDAGHLEVTEADTPSMNVVVAGGVGYIPNSSFDELDSDSVRFWEAVVGGTTGERTLSISSNSSGSTRIDLVCLKIDTGASPDYYASDVAELIIVEGTPGAGAPATPSNHLLLAEVEVVNGASSIEDADITDERVQALFKVDFIPPTSDTVETLTNKRITKRVTSIASSATPTPNADTTDQYQVTALAAGATFGAPTGTPTNGQGLVIRIKDNGTARSLAFNAIYREIGVSLPTTTVINKTIYLGCIYNTADSKWDVVAVAEEE